MVRVIGGGLESFLARRMRKQAMNIVAEAEREAAELVAKAAEEAETLPGGATSEAKDKVRVVRRRAVAEAQLEARETLLRVQQEMLDRVWRVAAKRLGTLDGDSTPEDRLARLRVLAREAAEQLGDGELLLQVNCHDAKLMTPEVLEHWMDAWQHDLPGLGLSLAETPASIMGGVIVRARNGHEMVDNSYDQRLKAAQTSLRGVVMEILA